MVNCEVAVRSGTAYLHGGQDVDQVKERKQVKILRVLGFAWEIPLVARQVRTSHFYKGQVRQKSEIVNPPCTLFLVSVLKVCTATATERVIALLPSRVPCSLFILTRMLSKRISWYVIASPRVTIPNVAKLQESRARTQRLIQGPKKVFLNVYKSNLISYESIPP